MSSKDFVCLRPRLILTAIRGCCFLVYRYTRYICQGNNYWFRVLDWHVYRTGYQNSEYFFLNRHAVCAPFLSRYLKLHMYTLSSTLTIKLQRHLAKLHIYAILCRHVHDRSLGPLTSCLYPVACLPIHSIYRVMRHKNQGIASIFPSVYFTSVILLTQFSGQFFHWSK